MQKRIDGAVGHRAAANVCRCAANSQAARSEVRVRCARPDPRFSARSARKPGALDQVDFLVQSHSREPPRTVDALPRTPRFAPCPISVTGLSEQGQSTQALPVAGGYQRQLHREGHEAAGTMARGLRQRYPGAPSVGNDGDVDGGLTQGPASGLQHQPVRGSGHNHPGRVVHQRRPAASRMLDAGQRPGPTLVDGAVARRPDHPAGEQPTIGEHVPHLLRCGRGVPSDARQQHPRSVNLPQPLFERVDPVIKRTAHRSRRRAWLGHNCAGAGDDPPVPGARPPHRALHRRWGGHPPGLRHP